jgi:hypothetical protein
VEIPTRTCKPSLLICSNLDLVEWLAEPEVEFPECGHFLDVSDLELEN